jgi:L-seryl-tRNA(Ser) seleniumtransferase
MMNRRSLFRRGGLLAAAQFLPRSIQRLGAAPMRQLELGSSIYESVGVRPLVNCKGTFTIITGSQTLPEVKQAMVEASKHYVQMDELMNAVGTRLAELTKAEWGIVTAGCAAAATHITSACIAGTNPEKMQKLPKLDGLKNQVIMPKYSRNVYDHAVRMLGVDIIEVTTPEEMEKAINPRTAMALVLSCPEAEKGPLTMATVARIGKAHNLPTVTDAAAEELTIPNIHLAKGIDIVLYSGGKCIRGPQAAGLALGRKDILQAAWLNSAPHHAFGRSLKVGKEEIMGMLTAVEMWTKRDHDAEWKTWESWNGYIADKVKRVPGVTTEIEMPEDLSNHAPVLRIKWDGVKLGITGREVEKVLLEGSPRIILAGSSGTRDNMANSSVSIMPYMMMPGDHKIAGDALYAVLSKPPKIDVPAPPNGEPAQLTGQWNVHVEYTLGDAHHVLIFEQSGDQLHGTHNSEFLTGDLRGKVQANQVHFRSAHRIQGTAVMYDFTGSADGDTMHGTVTMGEYGEARWTAHRHKYA